MDLLVNNAGVSLFGRFDEMSIDDFEWVINIYLRARRPHPDEMATRSSRPRRHLGDSHMNTIQNQMIAAHTLVTAYITGAFERLQNEKGQGSVEYSGIVLLVAALVAAAIAAASTDVISGLVKEKIGDAFDKLS
ncbi:MAG TPA: hypothetical protein PLP55_01835 [Phycicoccus elongatus]|uniref:Uncharacterized protein n=1 Tax=Phycicoccus elongatus Lp2 TaxID=1193181 RepID=N0E558_9MICO|nr:MULTISPECIES: hypothetical protein [Phycicoccus]MCB1240222.1 hypothetical protein [Tetrasphaera sp.]MCB9407085.1 hypothetical protein [Tetrasphaera sp.]MCO5303205.1 hypothetical protein [Phycicoccus sp.]CCH71125.1 hypothetical protein BN10_800029 [Phycicoccus elongatus Lp2]HPK11404.1 hypothetical protein [Phycicoccus elongatus]